VGSLHAKVDDAWSQTVALTLAPVLVAPGAV
jgi:hypothetical protein